MAQVWGMINGLQIIVMLPLFMINFPQLSFTVIESLITIATFDAFPTELVYEATIEPPEDDEQALEKFENIGFEANFMILNLGTLFLIFIILLILPCFLFFTKPCKNCTKGFKKKHKGMSKSVKGNAYIRFILEGGLDIAICASLNFQHDKRVG
mmetsp:Transcript_26104/g.34906  ORF Transcript_26104/g.34906 Transcript_26104/m.34906 type:complete len:154 (-) Transcript_26104:1104-1565(-)